MDIRKPMQVDLRQSFNSLPAIFQSRLTWECLAGGPLTISITVTVSSWYSSLFPAMGFCRPVGGVKQADVMPGAR